MGPRPVQTGDFGGRASVRPLLDAPGILGELSKRWGAAATLEYHSRAVLNHFGEFRIAVSIHVRLRRPNLARVLLDADRAEMTRLRVCDGLRIFDRMPRTPSFPPQTTTEEFTGRVCADIPHPLDEISYCVEQFFSPSPFLPPSTWGQAGRPRSITGSIVATPTGMPTRSKEVFRIVLAQGPIIDTLTIEPVSLRPLEIARVGDHAGRIQEILRETFLDVSLGAYCPPSLFRWTDSDESGRSLAAETGRS